jgi:hypothetical protein
MPSKTIAATALAIFLPIYRDPYRLGYSNSARHDPRDTSGPDARATLAARLSMKRLAPTHGPTERF